MSVAAKMRENTASMTRELKFLGENQGDQCGQSILTRQYAFTLRKVDTRKKKRDTTRDCRGHE